MAQNKRTNEQLLFGVRRRGWDEHTPPWRQNNIHWYVPQSSDFFAFSMLKRVAEPGFPSIKRCDIAGTIFPAEKWGNKGEYGFLVQGVEDRCRGWGKEGNNVLWALSWWLVPQGRNEALIHWCWTGDPSARGKLGFSRPFHSTCAGAASKRVHLIDEGLSRSKPRNMWILWYNSRYNLNIIWTLSEYTRNYIFFEIHEEYMDFLTITDCNHIDPFPTVASSTHRCLPR